MPKVIAEFTNRPLAEVAKRHLLRFGVSSAFDNRYTSTMFKMPEMAGQPFGLLVSDEDADYAQDLLDQLQGTDGVDLSIDENFDVGHSDDVD